MLFKNVSADWGTSINLFRLGAIVHWADVCSRMKMHYTRFMYQCHDESDSLCDQHDTLELETVVSSLIQ